ncbi:ABC transporter permease, partial [Mesorhizobium sp. M1C.F.Ca.ET.210.01.1.1]
MSLASASLDHASHRDGVINADALRADARRESRGMFALLSPGLFLVFAVIIVPIGWLFWLSLFDESGQLSA